MSAPDIANAIAALSAAYEQPLEELEGIPRVEPDELHDEDDEPTGGPGVCLWFSHIEVCCRCHRARDAHSGEIMPVAEARSLAVHLLRVADEAVAQQP